MEFHPVTSVEKLKPGLVVVTGLSARQQELLTTALPEQLRNGLHVCMIY